MNPLSCHEVFATSQLVLVSPAAEENGRRRGRKGADPGPNRSGSDHRAADSEHLTLNTAVYGAMRERTTVTTPGRARREGNR